MSLRPPCCPNKNCPRHTQKPKPAHWYTKDGTYDTLAFGTIQRYKCSHCGKRFSERTFHIDYYAKKNVNYRRIFRQLISTGSTRDIARELGISCASVANRISRLARNAIAVLEELKTEILLSEDLAADGFESFAVSQYFPNNIHILAGKASQYIWYLNYVPLRRKGRMQDAQKQRRSELEKHYLPPKGILTAQFRDLLLHAIAFARKADRPLVLYTDEKLEYARAAAAIPMLKIWKAENRFKHVRISSKKARTTTNDLFAVNYIDRQLRKDLANHVRETVCFTRNVNNGMERLLIYLLYHNHFKDFREGKPRYTGVSHAEVAGLDKETEKRALRQVFTRRKLLSLEKVSGEYLKVWKREMVTPLRKGRDYLPLYALH